MKTTGSNPWPEAVSTVTAVYVLGAGLITMLGWVLDRPRLTDWINSGISAFPNAAICAILSAIALWAVDPNRMRARRDVARLLAGIVTLIGVLTLSEHTFGFDLGIDTLLFNQPWGQVASTSPMRMGLPASTSFTIIGIALFLATLSPRSRRLSSVLAIGAMAIALMSIVGYWFGANQLFGVARLTGIALQTSTMLAGLSIGLMFSIREFGVVAMLGRQDAGGFLVRRVLLPVIVLPLVLGWLRVVGQEAGLFDTAFGTSMMALTTIGMLILLLSWTAAGISRQSKIAAFAEQSVREQREWLRVTLSSIGDAVIATDTEGIVTFMNDVAASLTGWKSDEAVGKSLDEVFQIVNERTREREENPALRVMREGRIVGLINQTLLINKNEAEVPIDDSGSPIKDPQGNTIGAVLIFRDISERRQADKQRELLADQARMLDSGFDAIIVRDSQDRVISWNRVAEELYGWTDEEAKGRVTHALFQTVFPEPREEIMRALERDSRWAGELIHTRKNGSLVTVLSHWILDRDAQGQPRSVLEVEIDISERRRAEEALRQQREWLRVTLSSIGDAVIATDRNGTVTFLNHVAESLTGWKQEEAVGRPLRTVFHIVNEDTRAEVENPALRAMREGIIVGLANHTVLVCRDGNEKPIDDAGSPIRDANGTAIGSVLIFRDITQRRLIEKQREAAARVERRLAAIVESSADAIIATDFDLRITSWNQAAERMFGFSATEAVGQPIRLIIPQDRFAEEDDVMRRIQGGEKVEHFETERLHKNGTHIPVSLSVSPVYDSKGEVIGASKILRDITERTQAERDVRKAEERFRLAVEAAPAAMIMVDSRGAIVLANSLTEKLLGYGRNELIGMPVERFVPARFRTDHLNYRTKYLTDAAQRAMGAGRDLYAIRKDGSEVPVEIGLSPIHTPDGVFVISAITDITERKRMADAESKARLAAEDANRAKDEFLALLSHELRNPLSSILGWSVLLKTRQIPIEQAHRAIEVIERNARVETQLVESLLDLSRIAAGKLEMDSERVDLAVVLQSVVDSIRPSADAKGITLELAVPASPILLIGDSGRLQQVFSNLLSNAVKFTGNRGRIEIVCSRAESKAQVQIIDNGEGIDPDFIPHMFDRFRQAETAKSRKQGGLGLGLAIVRELISAHGGTVVAQSPGKGQGSTFTVKLPIPAVIPEHIKGRSLESADDMPPSIADLRVLIVDDDADARETIAVMLETRGAGIEMASSSAEAWECMRRRRPDLLIADIGMPQEDGYVLIQRLRRYERDTSEKRLAAIALTAYASPADRDHALAVGYDIHLTKPVPQDELIRAVGKFRKTQGREA
jgi:PAS domain S-box-containing protein